MSPSFFIKNTMSSRLSELQTFLNNSKIGVVVTTHSKTILRIHMPKNCEMKCVSCILYGSNEAYELYIIEGGFPKNYDNEQLWQDYFGTPLFDTKEEVLKELTNIVRA